MRIDALNQVAQIYGANKASKAYKTRDFAEVRDEVSISNAGRDLQVAKEAVAQAPDVREDLVADVKTRIQDGTYSVSDDDFASVLIEKFAELD